MAIALPLKVKDVVAPIEFVAMKVPEEYLEESHYRQYVRLRQRTHWLAESS